MAVAIELPCTREIEEALKLGFSELWEEYKSLLSVMKTLAPSLEVASSFLKADRAREHLVGFLKVYALLSFLAQYMPLLAVYLNAFDRVWIGYYGALEVEKSAVIDIIGNLFFNRLKIKKLHSHPSNEKCTWFVVLLPNKYFSIELPVRQLLSVLNLDEKYYRRLKYTLLIRISLDIPLREDVVREIIERELQKEIAVIDDKVKTKITEFVLELLLDKYKQYTFLICNFYKTVEKIWRGHLLRYVEHHRDKPLLI